MTRINIIPPSELHDQHLIAEYREITMVPAALKRTLKSKNGLDKDKIPQNYTLNKGHVYFFYDKGKYLDLRYVQIVKEMKNRGFKPDSERKFPKDLFVKNGLYGDWIPKVEDYEIVRKRIFEKINKRPGWYRHTKSAISFFGKWAESGKDAGMEEHHSQSVNFMIDKISKSSKDNFSFIDAGCGNGWVVRKMKEHSRCKYSSGIDGAVQMVDKAKLIDPESDYFHSDLIEWNPNKKYDFVHSMEVFYYFRDVSKILEKIYKEWLCQDGKLIFGVDHYGENKPSLNWPEKCGVFMNTLSIEEWKKLLSSVGFKNIDYWQVGKKDDWVGTLIFYAEK